MFSRIYHFLQGPNPLHPSVWKGRLSPMTFRRFSQQDLPKCLELYALNEPGRFPRGVIQTYEESLKGGNSYFLVGEFDGRIVASGGLAYTMREDIAVLCFGLVHPSEQGKGIGTALLLARLSLLKPNRHDYHVLIFAVKDSFGFYLRFGFRDFQAWKDPAGEMQPSGHLHITAREIRRCRALLKEQRIAVPEDEDEIPFRTKAA